MAHKTASGRSSDAWKAFERKIAELLRNAGFTQAHRVSRGDDIGVSDTDVKVPEVPFLMVDCKYRQGGWAHETIFEECEKKYVPKGSNKVLILPTKSGKKQGSLSTVRTEFLMELLAHRFLGGVGNSGLSCPQCRAYDLKLTKQSLGLVLGECSNCSKQFYMAEADVPPASFERNEAAA